MSMEDMEDGDTCEVSGKVFTYESVNDLFGGFEPAWHHVDGENVYRVECSGGGYCAFQMLPTLTKLIDDADSPEDAAKAVVAFIEGKTTTGESLGDPLTYLLSNLSKKEEP